VRASKVFLLLFILLFGGALETAWSVRNRVAFSPLGCRVLGGRFWGQSWSYDSEARFDAPANKVVEVQNSFGAVRVTQGQPAEVKVVLRKVVYAGSEQAARSFASRITIVGRSEGDGLRLTTNRGEFEEGDESRKGLETHLEIQVPPGTVLKVRNEHGVVEASDLDRADLATSFDDMRLVRVAGEATLEVRHGDLAAQDIGGSLSLTARHGDAEIKSVKGRATVDIQHGHLTANQVAGLSVTSSHGDIRIEDCQGDLNVQAQHGDVTAKQVAGRAQVATSFGDLELERLSGEVRAKAQNGEVSVIEAQGPVFAEASFDDVKLRQVAGAAEVTVSHGGVSAEDVGGDLRVKASGDDVDLSNVRGTLEVDVQRGGVTIAPGGPLAKAVSVKTTFGGIVLRIPAGSRVDLEASSLRGEVKVAATGFTVAESGSGRFRGQLGGGGNLVKLVSDNGDVRVETTTQEAHEPVKH